MDNRGWIHISLFATFKRVKQLTDSVHLVREVFSLSSVVQVHGDWVRMGGWEQYVLPNAPASTVEETFTFNGHPPHRPHLHLAPAAPQPQEFQKNAPTGNDEREGDDEVEIVLGDEVQSLSARRPA
ncbi:hypothetical protein FISHEDRAFT_34340 [Fistulina hepatica ATCC 64428]|uniref:HTH La-type RNA-binding domain-containing protein n=1 Tax=Fistulina hepatica ATCC 64428 TaxID=1128425 RepID=A0A0D7AQ35_9AGAR|nr:hypothetical protein FISHEDRAFT_34340 [Fistulina hepatica ATCC 64428]